MANQRVVRIRDLTNTQIDIAPQAMEVAEYFGLTEEHILQICRRPQRIETDPSSADREWYTERRRIGDVEVVITYPDRGFPRVWAVYVQTGSERRPTRTPGGAGGSSMPNTMRELKKRIVAAGLVIKSGGKHDRVEDKDGNFIVALPITPSDNHSIPNATMAIRRKGYDI